MSWRLVDQKSDNNLWRIWTPLMEIPQMFFPIRLKCSEFVSWCVRHTIIPFLFFLGDVVQRCLYDPNTLDFLAETVDGRESFRIKKGRALVVPPSNSFMLWSVSTKCLGIDFCLSYQTSYGQANFVMIIWIAHPVSSLEALSNTPSCEALNAVDLYAVDLYAQHGVMWESESLVTISVVTRLVWHFQYWVMLYNQELSCTTRKA